MAREAHIIGETVDIYGAHWDVRERRPTNHGFLVELGWPQGVPRGRGGHGVSTILTPPLAHYLRQTRPRDIDLPIAHTTRVRLRRELGVLWSYKAWWEDRKGDLLTMTLEEFCKAHGVSMGAASQWRTKFVERLPKLRGRDVRTTPRRVDWVLALLAHIATHPGARHKELQGVIGASYETVRRALKYAEDIYGAKIQRQSGGYTLLDWGALNGDRVLALLRPRP